MAQDATARQITLMNMVVAMALTAAVSVGGAMAWMYNSFSTVKEHDELVTRIAATEATVSALRDAIAHTQSQASANAQILLRIERGQDKVEAKIDGLILRVLRATGTQTPGPAAAAPAPQPFSGVAPLDRAIQSGRLKPANPRGNP